MSSCAAAVTSSGLTFSQVASTASERARSPSPEPIDETSPCQKRTSHCVLFCVYAQLPLPSSGVVSV